MERTAAITRPQGIEDLLDTRLIAKIAPLDLASRRLFAGKLKGERRSKRRGQSVEFADHRPYAVGDDLRRIDWNIYGRLDKLFLKLYLEEEDLSLHVVIDASASSDCGEPSKFFFMQRAAMALGYVGLTNLNRVAVTALIDGGERSLRDLRGAHRVHELAKFLCSLEPGGRVDFGRAAHRLALTRRGRGVMIVLSDFFFKEGYEQGLRLLSGRGYDLVALQVLSPQELEPTLAGDLKLKDIEDADTAEVTISAPLLKRYKMNLAAYTQALREFCVRRQITQITARSDAAVDQLLLGAMKTRGVLA